MLCKSKINSLTVWNDYILTCTGGSSTKWDILLGSMTTLSGWECDININYTSSIQNAKPAYIFIKVDGEEVYRSNSITSSTSSTLSTSFTLDAWVHTIELRANNYSGTYSSYISTATCTATITPIIYGEYIGGIPLNITSIWDTGYVNIFGKDGNNFFTWLEPNSVTTGAITPWNFVGYIQIGKYKIPYYL